MGHLGESHLAPFRYSFIFSRRQSLQSAPVYRAICQYSSDPAPLRRPAAVVRNWCDVLDRPDLQAGRLQGPDGGLPPRAWALDEHVNLAHPVLHGPPCGRLGRHLRGERAPVADALVGADLHLAPDVGLHLAAQVSFDPVGGVDPVTQLDHVVVGEIVHPDVAADAGGLQRLERAGAADPVNVGEGDLKALVAREVNANQPCHLRAVLLRPREVWHTAPPSLPGRAPASCRGFPYRTWGPVRVRCTWLALSPGAACASGRCR